MHMNNKKGSFGAKLLFVLFLMIASAIGGAYTYRVFDGKMAVRDALKDVNSIKVSEYDSVEATQVQSYIDDAKTNLDTASSRKEVYEIMQDFNEDVDKVMTKTEKELEQARKEAEEAKKKATSTNEDESTESDTEEQTEDDNSSKNIFDIFN